MRKPKLKNVYCVHVPVFVAAVQKSASNIRNGELYCNISALVIWKYCNHIYVSDIFGHFPPNHFIDWVRADFDRSLRFQTTRYSVVKINARFLSQNSIYTIHKMIFAKKNFPHILCSYLCWLLYIEIYLRSNIIQVDLKREKNMKIT